MPVGRGRALRECSLGYAGTVIVCVHVCVLFQCRSACVYVCVNVSLYGLLESRILSELVLFTYKVEMEILFLLIHELLHIFHSIRVFSLHLHSFLCQ